MPPDFDPTTWTETINLKDVRGTCGGDAYGFHLAAAACHRQDRDAVYGKRPDVGTYWLAIDLAQLRDAKADAAQLQIDCYKNVTAVKWPTTMEAAKWIQGSQWSMWATRTPDTESITIDAVLDYPRLAEKWAIFRVTKKDGQPVG